MFHSRDGPVWKFIFVLWSEPWKNWFSVSRKSDTTVKKRTKWLVLKLCYVVFTDSTAVYSSTSPQPTMFETCFCLTLPTVSLFRDIWVRVIHIPLYRHRYIMHMWKILLLIRLKSCDNIRLYDRYQYTNSIKWDGIGVTLLNKIQPLKVYPTKFSWKYPARCPYLYYTDIPNFIGAAVEV